MTHPTDFSEITVLIIIPARGGSKGIPRKNLRTLAGKPLLYYSIQNGLNISFHTDVYVSSEDDEILHMASKLGAKTHRRNLSLSGDHITLDPVIYDAYQEIEKKEKKSYQLIITLQPTSPLLKHQSIEEAIQKMLLEEDIDTMISATNDTHLCWGKKDDAFFPKYTERVNRQYLEPVFKETGGFLITRNTIINSNTRIGNKVSLYELSSNESIDIDTFEDWNLCEYYLSRKKIAFCVSGYPKIGLGHVYNTLLLANEILNHEVFFFVDDKSDLAYQKIKENNYPVFQQKTADYISELMALEPDMLINDRLDTSAEEMSALKKFPVKIINFEDLGSGASIADLVFNAIYPEKESLKNHYFGQNYFCARDEFILSDPIQINEKLNTILISFGGVDPNNLTLKTLESIYDYCVEQDIEIHVVAGLGYSKYDDLKGFEKLNIHKNISNISSYMQMADLAFTSAGRTTYELAILGVPSIVMGQNDREMTHFFATSEYGFENLGLGSEVNHSAILDSFARISSQKETRMQMQQKMLAHDLRNGKQKVIRIIKNAID
jgi:CMP-N-acetylneuraminic acid synthetase/spore coat polysaccharide biosynthesis predicted glycosyltransferase SpsG